MIIFLSNLIKSHSFLLFDLSVIKTEIFSEGTKVLFVQLTYLCHFGTFLHFACHFGTIGYFNQSLECGVKKDTTRLCRCKKWCQKQRHFSFVIMKVMPKKCHNIKIISDLFSVGFTPFNGIFNLRSYPESSCPGSGCPMHHNLVTPTYCLHSIAVRA